MDKSDTLPERLNWKQACALLGCGRSYFYVLLRKGCIPYIRIGKRKGIQIVKADIMMYLDSKKQN